MSEEYGFRNRHDTSQDSQFDVPFKKWGNNHGKYAGVVDIARNGIDEVIRLHDENLRLKTAIERMRVAGGSQEFQMAFELAKDLIAVPPEPTFDEWWNRKPSECLIGRDTAQWIWQMVHNAKVEADGAGIIATVAPRTTGSAAG